MTTTEKNAIIEMLTPILDSDGIELVDVETHRQTLRLLIYKPDGLSVKDCQTVNYIVQPILEVHELFKGYTQLEVASPGVDRPLRTARDFQRNCGRTVRIEVDPKSENASENEQEHCVQGVVVEVQPEMVILEQTDGKSTSVEISQIRTAHIHLQW